MNLPICHESNYISEYKSERGPEPPISAEGEGIEPSCPYGTASDYQSGTLPLRSSQAKSLRRFPWDENIFTGSFLGSSVWSGTSVAFAAKDLAVGYRVRSAGIQPPSPVLSASWRIRGMIFLMFYLYIWKR